MDIQNRKIEFLQSFLELQNEDIILQFERLLNSLKELPVQQKIKPLTIDELNKRIDTSENDFINNKFKSTSELLSKY